MLRTRSGADSLTTLPSLPARALTLTLLAGALLATEASVGVVGTAVGAVGTVGAGVLWSRSLDGIGLVCFWTSCVFALAVAFGSTEPVALVETNAFSQWLK